MDFELAQRKHPQKTDVLEVENEHPELGFSGEEEEHCGSNVQNQASDEFALVNRIAEAGSTLIWRVHDEELLSRQTAGTIR